MKSTGFALLVLIAPLLTDAVKPPPGSRGTIDFRYPDYIVEPRPKCKSEGVFPHPRDCKWYFRCHDAYGIGYFRQFYFECEPGTVFSDELDQCIHPHDVDRPCGTRGPPIPTQPPRPSPTPTPAPAPRVCYDSMFRCKKYYCPDANNKFVMIGRQCESAFEMCSDGVKTYYCAEEQFYDIASRGCVQAPETRGCVEEDFLATSTTSTTTTTTTTTTTKPPRDDCYDSMVECKQYDCPTPGENFLCKKAFKTCNFNKLSFYCDDLHYFNYRTKECVDPPSKTGCKVIGESTTLAPVTTTIVDPSTFTFSFSVVCSTTNLRPKDPKLSQYYCADHPACLNGKSSRVELCLKYLQCGRTDNKWTVVIMDCPPGLFYNYDRDSCIPKPEETCAKERFYGR